MQLSTFKILNMFNAEIYMFQMQIERQQKQITHAINIQCTLKLFQIIAIFFFNEHTLNKLHQNKQKGKQPLIIQSEAVSADPIASK